MNVLVNLARIPSDPFMIRATISAVFGCGVMPAGQMSTRNFTVTGFTLPVAMVYSTAPSVPTQVPGIATSETGAAGFVQRLVIRTVFDALESQARSALLPDAIISAILHQLTVTVSYTPLMCANVCFGLMDQNQRGISSVILRDFKLNYNKFQKKFAYFFYSPNSKQMSENYQKRPSNG
ncbi:hypothetical protein KIN20_021822 [Parelaphostrongylus tenuis]|uniref:Uncharacterized protein n=1 Tax=Parelaphostrongylus tenuis TaxID=148309 RepID=A0AAD5QUS4_PARTN|nr:hypothetical protein KIN20_021822 [Parelaphostrongylus tenuis]